MVCVVDFMGMHDRPIDGRLFQDVDADAAAKQGEFQPLRNVR
ncbi:hypothetical protein V7x_07310 [Crateriforma conspicua]|uniref:Uncharacterized protein n=1 Tax=Crateriforma conspicua TaxID=2527996 RepID=A0A5C6FUC9_9PLAN|nr:hypothetical protein V7x_07310 [Crateriforma conspicua]